jgi:hypothetical protein
MGACSGQRAAMLRWHGRWLPPHVTLPLSPPVVHVRRTALPGRLVPCSTPSKKPNAIFFLMMPSLTRSAHAQSVAMLCAAVPGEPPLPPRAPPCRRRLGVTSSQAGHRSEPTKSRGLSASSTALASLWSAISSHPPGMSSPP